MSGATFFLGLHQAAETAVPIAIGLIVDYAIATADFARLSVSLAALAALFIVLSYAWRFGARLLNVAYQRESHALRVEVARRILDPRGLDSPPKSGEFITISTSDADNEAEILDAIPRAIAAIVAVTLIAAALLTIHLPLGVAVLIGTPLILLGLQAATPGLVRRTHAQQETVAHAAAMATDLLSGLRPLRGVGGEESAARRYRQASRRALAARMRAATAHGAYTGVSMTVSALLAVSVAAAAGWLALSGALTVGELIIVAGLAQFLLEPLSTLAVVPGHIARARGSAQRLASVLAAPPLLPESENHTASPGKLELESIAYRSLRGVTFTAAPGEFAAIYAYDPADSDALALVLSGQLPPRDYSGVVRISGVPLSDLTTAAVREVMLSEPHHTDLFAGTLRENITLGRTAETDTTARVDAALRASAADDVAALHTAGLDHEIGEQGGTLSGGQRQRVALARALYAQTPILILHDATTGVDAVTDHAIARGVRVLRTSPASELARPHTTIAITASPAFLSAADRVIVIADGAVAAEGTHAQLLAQDPRYREAVTR